MTDRIVTAADIAQAVRVFKRYPNGITRKEAARILGGDRYARDVIAAVVETGAAPVITAKALFGDGQVYRLARNEEEVQAAARNLVSYELSLRRRREGLLAAWEGKGTQQAELFGEVA